MYLNSRTIDTSIIGNSLAALAQLITVYSNYIVVHQFDNLLITAGIGFGYRSFGSPNLGTENIRRKKS